MYSWNVEEENGRFRWTVYRNGKQIMTGTRKRKAEAEKEATGSIRHTEKIEARDRAAA